MTTTQTQTSSSGLNSLAVPTSEKLDIVTLLEERQLAAIKKNGRGAGSLEYTRGESSGIPASQRAQKRFEELLEKFQDPEYTKKIATSVLYGKVQKHIGPNDEYNLYRIYKANGEKGLANQVLTQTLNRDISFARSQANNASHGLRHLSTIGTPIPPSADNQKLSKALTEKLPDTAKLPRSTDKVFTAKTKDGQEVSIPVTQEQLDYINKHPELKKEYAEKAKSALEQATRMYEKYKNPKVEEAVLNNAAKKPSLASSILHDYDLVKQLDVADYANMLFSGKINQVVSRQEKVGMEVEYMPLNSSYGKLQQLAVKGTDYRLSEYMKSPAPSSSELTAAVS